MPRLVNGHSPELLMAALKHLVHRMGETTVCHIMEDQSIAKWNSKDGMALFN